MREAHGSSTVTLRADAEAVLDAQLDVDGVAVRLEAKRLTHAQAVGLAGERQALGVGPA